MKREMLPGNCRTAVVGLLTVVFLLGVVAPAFCWQNVKNVHCTFRRKLPVAGPADGAGIRATGWASYNGGSSWSQWTTPLMHLPNPNSPTNVWPPAALSFTVTQWSSLNGYPPTSYFNSSNYITRVVFGGTGVNITGPSLPYWFYVRYHFGPVPPPSKKVLMAFSWIQSSLGAYPANLISGGYHQVLNIQISSPPVFFNPTETMDGTANTGNMVIRNLQFAVSPALISGEELSLDNPDVQDLFSASLDPFRAGPFVITPGNSYQPVLDPSIVDPQPGGSTVIGKGTVEDENGEEQDFLVQFDAEEDTSVAVGYSSRWLIITLLSLSICGAYLLRKKAKA